MQQSTPVPEPVPPSPRAPGALPSGGGSSARWRVAGLGVVILALHAAAFGTLVLLVAPHRYAVGSEIFGVGLGVTAYTLGLRHAFDADHIAAIDNTTRKLMADGGRRPVSVGFWFALGHSAIVVVLAALIAAGTHLATTLTSDSSGTHRALSLVGTIASGGFLYLIAVLNLGAFAGIIRAFRALRRGDHDPEALERVLASRGLLARLLGRVTGTITRPGQMFAVGLLFGVGFDTASEVTLLVLAGSSSAAGLPWYAVLCLPLLFAAGMSLFDTLDGLFMTVAYRWAFAEPVRKIYYNLVVTGLSVAVALVIGSIELIGVLHDDAGLTDPITGWIAALSLNDVGFVIVGLFVVVWGVAVAYWRIARVDQRWQQRPAAAGDQGIPTSL